MRPQRRSSLLAVAALVVTVGSLPLGALASHQFGDVSDSNPYHNDIDALADSGVTSGCGGGNFCPSALVTREQMAAFMNRLGALAPGKTPVVNATKLDGLDSTQFARSDVPVTGHFNCMGRALQPESSTVAYQWDNGARYVTSGEGGFECAVFLPQGSTVTAVRCWVHDLNVTGQADCFLVRAALDGLPYGLLANTPDYAPTPGEIMLEDLVIDSPVIDNTLYAYNLVVFLGGTSLTLKVYSMSVEYTVSGLPVV